MSDFELRVRECDRAVLRLVLSLTGSERKASELYRDIFDRLYMERKSGVGQESFELRAFRAAASRCLDYLQSTEQRSWVRKSCSLAAGTMALLSPRERLVFGLKHYQGLRLRTIAEILETNEAGVSKVFSRAVRKLSFVLSEFKSENTSRV